MSEPQTEQCRLHAKGGSSWDPSWICSPGSFAHFTEDHVFARKHTRRTARRITSMSYPRDVHDDGETVLGEVAERLVKSDGPHGIMYSFRYDIG
jgi:hypothetical protein